MRTQFLLAARAEQCEIPAYCVMPDHLHLLVSGLQERFDLRRFVHRAKQKSGYLFVRERGERLWQDSYFDRTVRRDESIAEVIRYIVAILFERVW